MTRPFLTLAFFALSTGFFCAVSHAQSQASITVDAHQTLGPVNRKIFGQCIKGADNHGIFSAKTPDQKVLRYGNGVWNPILKQAQPPIIKLLQKMRPGSMRYPGGLAVHGYNWKEFIGPVEKRGLKKFGLEEYLKICRELNSEPQIVVSEYVGEPSDAADLVEYLNMPASPNTPWAKIRSQAGQTKPHNVKYFEIGNESWVDHRKLVRKELRQPYEAGLRARAIILAMKAIDPTIKTGVPVREEEHKQWSEDYLRGVGDAADFLIFHVYTVRLGGNAPMPTKVDQLATQAAVASNQQAIQMMHDVQNISKRVLGKVLPLAITEYNASYVQKGKPEVKYRLTLAAGLFCADNIRYMLQPKSNVITANYWMLLNNYWAPVWSDFKTGQIQNKYAPVHFFELWGEQFGDALLKTQVQSPTQSFAGFNRAKPAIGQSHQPAKPLATINLIKPQNKRALANGKTFHEMDGSDSHINLKLDHFTGQAYPEFIIIPNKQIPKTYQPSRPGLMYRATFDAKWTPQENSAPITLGLGMMDLRGWTKSGSAVGIDLLQNASQWTRMHLDYMPRPDTPGIVVLLRLIGGSDPTSGKLQIRNLKIEPWQDETFPEYPLITSTSSLSKDGKTLYVMVINKSADKDLSTHITLENFKASKVCQYVVNGKAMNATNKNNDDWVGRTHDGTVLKMPSSNSITHAFPAHSMTCLRFEK